MASKKVPASFRPSCAFNLRAGTALALLDELISGRMDLALLAERMRRILADPEVQAFLAWRRAAHQGDSQPTPTLAARNAERTTLQAGEEVVAGLRMLLRPETAPQAQLHFAAADQLTALTQAWIELARAETEKRPTSTKAGPGQRSGSGRTMRPRSPSRSERRAMQARFAEIGRLIPLAPEPDRAQLRRERKALAKRLGRPKG